MKVSLHRLHQWQIALKTKTKHTHRKVILLYICRGAWSSSTIKHRYYIYIYKYIFKIVHYHSIYSGIDFFKPKKNKVWHQRIKSSRIKYSSIQILFSLSLASDNKKGTLSQSNQWMNQSINQVKDIAGAHLGCFFPMALFLLHLSSFSFPSLRCYTYTHTCIIVLFHVLLLLVILRQMKCSYLLCWYLSDWHHWTHHRTHIIASSNTPGVAASNLATNT